MFHPFVKEMYEQQVTVHPSFDCTVMMKRFNMMELHKVLQSHVRRFDSCRAHHNEIQAF
jgi:hypothetical protein